MEKLLQKRAELTAKIDALIESCADDATFKAATDEFDANEKAIKRVADQEGRKKQLEADAKAEEDRKRLMDREEQRNARRMAGAGRLTAGAEGSDNRQVRRDDQGREVASIEDAGESVSVVFDDNDPRARIRQSYRAQVKDDWARLKTHGYVPRGVFKSFADFCRDGFSLSETKFEAKLAEHCAPILDERGNFISLRPSAAVQGASEGVASEGGFFVPPEYSAGILQNIFTNSLLARTDNYAVTGNSMTFRASAETSRATGSRSGGIQSYIIPEGGSITSSLPKTREVSIKLLKLGVVIYFTQELLDDGGAAFQTWSINEANREFNFRTGDYIVNGTGGGQPLGVLNSPSLVSIAKESGQAAATLLPENLVKMYSRFLMAKYPGSYWYMNQDITPQLNLMTLALGTSAATMFMPPNGLASAPFGTLQGRPIEPTEFNPTLGTQGDILLCDLGDMLSISKGGIAQAVSMHIQFLTDQQAVRLTFRYNHRPWWSAPLTPYKGGSNTQSTFVALDTRA